MKWKAILFIMLILGLAIITPPIYKFLYAYFESPINPRSKMTTIATAEEIINENFHHYGFNVSGKDFQSNEAAFKGSYSLKLQAPDQSIGFEYEIKNAQVEDVIQAGAWVYAPKGTLGTVVIAGIGDNAATIYAQSNKSHKQEGDWHFVQVSHTIETLPNNRSFRAYCLNTTEAAIYFDDMAIFHKSLLPFTWEPQVVQIGMKEGEYGQLKKKRDEAFELGMLVTAKDSWVKGFIFPQSNQDKKTSVSLRLKGDWLDHLEGKKWSFRVKTKPEVSWKRMKVFSFQNPRNRGYINEWLLHKFFNWQDILTPRYEFIDLMLNGKDLGLYVYEEHFTKQLLEYSLRKEGPIVKFSETYFWESYLQAKKEGLAPEQLKRSYSLQIQPFSESKTAASPLLTRYFETAQNLMFEYQWGIKKAKDIFDLESLAKYYAILDVTGGHHGAIWHNQRFYYNPVTSKLEPIGFDGYGNVAETFIKTAFIGVNLSTKNTDKEWHTRLFMDLDFLKKYIYYLNKFSQENQLKPFLDSMDQAINDRTRYIQKSVPYYQYSTNYIYDRAARIRNALQPQSTILQSRTVEVGKIGVCNRHKTVLEVIGTSTDDNGRVVLFDSSHFIYTTPMEEMPDYEHQINIPENAQYLVYKVIGLEKKHYAKIGLWPIPLAFTAAQELQGNLVANHPAYYYDKKSKRVVFKKKHS